MIVDSFITDIKMSLKIEKTEVKSVNVQNHYPPLYNEIYNSYTSKDYQGCLNYIEQVKEEHVEYKILRSACLIQQGKVGVYINVYF